MKNYGTVVKEKRILNKLTQTDLASKLNISNKYLSDIEVGRRVPSKNLREKISKILSINQSEDEFEFNQEERVRMLTEKIKEMEVESDRLEILIKQKLFEYERMEKTVGARSKITWLCIDIQKSNAQSIIELINLFDLLNEKDKTIVWRPVKQLFYHLESLTDKLKDFLEKIEGSSNRTLIEEKNMEEKNIFEKYNIPIPKRKIYEFDEEDMIKILTYKVGTLVPRVLKDLDVYINEKKQFNARKTSLAINGKEDSRKAYKMKSYIKEYGEFFNKVSINITQALEDIINELISDMIKYNKNPRRKEKFFKTLDSIEGQQLIFIVGMISLGDYLINQYGYIKNGRYLEAVLKARKELKSKITQIFKEVNRGLRTQEEANSLFKTLIAMSVQEQTNIDMNLYREIHNENLLFELCEEESVAQLIYDVVDGAREKATGEKRLLELL